MADLEKNPCDDLPTDYHDMNIRDSAHWPLLASSVDISDYDSVNGGGPTYVSQHNPQQFHGQSRSGRKCWCDWGSMRKLSPIQFTRWICRTNVDLHNLEKNPCDDLPTDYHNINIKDSTHWPLLASSVGISDYDSVKGGGPTYVSQHNPQQFRSGRKCWCDWGSMRKLSPIQFTRWICRTNERNKSVYTGFWLTLVDKTF